MKAIYMIDKEDRLVRCFLTDISLREEPFIGEAKCHADDVFDIEKGMEISIKRAMLSRNEFAVRHLTRKVRKLNKKASETRRMADTLHHLKCVQQGNVDTLKKELSEFCS